MQCAALQQDVAGERGARGAPAAALLRHKRELHGGPMVAVFRTLLAHTSWKHLASQSHPSHTTGMLAPGVVFRPDGVVFHDELTGPLLRLPACRTCGTLSFCSPLCHITVAACLQLIQKLAQLEKPAANITCLQTCASWQLVNLALRLRCSHCAFHAAALTCYHAILCRP